MHRALQSIRRETGQRLAPRRGRSPRRAPGNLRHDRRRSLSAGNLLGGGGGILAPAARLTRHTLPGQPAARLAEMPMSFTMTCPECDAELGVPDSLAGKTLRCRKCGETFKARAPGSKSGRARRPRDDEDSRPRRPRDEEENDHPRRRRRDENDDRDDDRPRRKPADGKARGKRSKPKRGLGYVLGLIGALLLAAGAITFVAWKAGAFGPKAEKGVILDAKGQPEYVPPDERIKAPPRAGPAKLQLGSPPPQLGAHVRLTAPVLEGGTLVITYQFLGNYEPGPEYVLVIVHPEGWETQFLDRLAEDTGAFKLNPPKGRIEVWVGKVGRNAGPADPGSRVSNVVTYG